MEWIYGINWLDVISGVIIVIAGYFIVKSIAKSTAADVLNRWVREILRPVSVDRGPSCFPVSGKKRKR